MVAFAIGSFGVWENISKGSSSMSVDLRVRERVGVALLFVTTCHTSYPAWQYRRQTLCSANGSTAFQEVGMPLPDFTDLVVARRIRSKTAAIFAIIRTSREAGAMGVARRGAGS